MKTRFSILILSALFLFQISCRKSNANQPTTTLVLSDSLLNWIPVGSIPNEFPEDISFVSPSKGFIAADEIFQSTDSGKTWTEVASNNLTTYFNLFFLTPQYGFAQGPSQLGTTTDGGNTWEVKQFPTSNGLTFFFTTPSTGFYGDESAGGLYKTTDTGTTWKKVFDDMQTQKENYPFFLNPDSGFVVSGAGSFATSVDSGNTWQTISSILPVNPTMGNYHQLLFLDAKTGFYGSAIGIEKTTDGGTTWNNVLPLTNSLNVIKFVDAQTGFYMTSSTIYKTTDKGSTWTINCSLGSQHFVGMNFIDIHTGWAVTSEGTIFRMQE